MITILAVNVQVWIFIEQQEKQKQHDQLVSRWQKVFIKHYMQPWTRAT